MIFAAFSSTFGSFRAPKGRTLLVVHVEEVVVALLALAHEVEEAGRLRQHIQAAEDVEHQRRYHEQKDEILGANRA